MVCIVASKYDYGSAVNWHIFAGGRGGVRMAYVGLQWTFSECSAVAEGAPARVAYIRCNRRAVGMLNPLLNKNEGILQTGGENG